MLGQTQLKGHVAKTLLSPLTKYLFALLWIGRHVVEGHHGINAAVGTQRGSSSCTINPALHTMDLNLSQARYTVSDIVCEVHLISSCKCHIVHLLL